MKFEIILLIIMIAFPSFAAHPKDHPLKHVGLAAVAKIPPPVSVKHSICDLSVSNRPPAQVLKINAAKAKAHCK